MALRNTSREEEAVLWNLPVSYCAIKSREDVSDGDLERGPDQTGLRTGFS